MAGRRGGGQKRTDPHDKTLGTLFRRAPLDHPAGFQEITRVLIGCPDAKEGSVTSAMARDRVIALQTGVEHLLELQFDGGCRATTLDFRPTLPLIFRV